MVAIFLEFLNVSIMAGWLILAIIFLRWIFPKIPKRARLVFWGLVGLRLILFVSVESVFSLIPSARTILPAVMFMPRPEITSGLSLLDKHLNPVIAKTFAPTPGNSANPLQIVFFVLAVLWLAGVIVLLLSAGIRTLRLCHRVKDAVLLEENIYQSENISAPFVFGFRHPRIYLPSGMGQDAMYYVVLHEQTHIVRRDHWDKMFGYLLLCLYWFHPLCHVAYRLFCRDMELACDEQVIQKFSEDRDFSENLGVSENGELSGNLGFSENVELSENPGISENGELSENLGVSENVELSGNLDFSENGEFSKNLEFSEKEQINYAEALSVLCAPCRGIHMCLMTLGEAGGKEREKNVLHYKKPASWVNVAAVFIGIFLAVCFLTNPNEGSALKRHYVQVSESGNPLADGQISLEKDGSFTLVFSGLSSYIAHGAYEAAGGRLMLWTMRGGWYIFDMVGGTLVFDADASSEVRWWKDGEIFE